LEYLLIVAVRSGWFGVERISYIPWNPFFNASISSIFSFAVLNLLIISASSSLNFSEILMTVSCSVANT
jgi:hypothetical protein